MKILDVPQGSAEWLAARAGKVTASRIEDVLAKIRTGEAAARRDYRAQLVAEILTGRPQENGYINAEMQWGIDYEPIARSAYEVETGRSVDQVGFVIHPRIERAGASPDGIAGEGLVEIKCPKTATHIGYLSDGEVPAKYEAQMLWQLACTGAAWVDFVSFDPRLPPALQLFVARMPRIPDEIARMEEEVIVFLREVDATIAKLTRGERS